MIDPLNFSWINEPTAWVSLITLTALEIVLGIDNIIFISILVGRLPESSRQLARVLGLALAMGTRILLLLSLAWLMRLTTPLFSFFHWDLSGRDLILLIGGLFLIAKSTHEMHQSFEHDSLKDHPEQIKHATFLSILIQIALIDIIFSLDSVITAVGLAQYVSIMIIAIVISVIIMMLAAKPIGDYIDKHPSLKMLALSFLILVGVALMGEGLSLHIPKGYIYFAMGYAFSVELINIKLREAKKRANLTHNA